MRDFAIEAADLKDINTPELCAVQCVAKMGSTSPTGAIRITVGLETGYECYCGAADHVIPSNYKTDIGSCSTPCAGATCVKETGEGCCGGYWTINTVKVDCTGVPITPAAGPAFSPLEIGIISCSGILILTVIIGLIVGTTLYNFGKLRAKIASQSSLRAGHDRGAATSLADPLLFNGSSTSNSGESTRMGDIRSMEAGNYGAIAAPGAVDFRAELTKIWTAHAPEKLETVDKVLLKYRGKSR